MGRPRLIPAMVGNTYARLTVTGIDEEHKGRVIVNCSCGTIGMRVDAGNVRRGVRRSCGCLNREQASVMGATTNRGKTGEAHPSYGVQKEKHHNWKGDAVSYAGAHWRLKAWFGPARTKLCFNCGVQARDWAFNNACADARMQVGGEGDGMYYCIHPECYVAACRRCHSGLIDENDLMVIRLGDCRVLAPKIAKAVE